MSDQYNFNEEFLYLVDNNQITIKQETFIIMKVYISFTKYNNINSLYSLSQNVEYKDFLQAYNLAKNMWEITNPNKKFVYYAKKTKIPQRDDIREELLNLYPDKYSISEIIQAYKSFSKKYNQKIKSEYYIDEVKLGEFETCYYCFVNKDCKYDDDIAEKIFIDLQPPKLYIFLKQNEKDQIKSILL
jgi:hypothetical protein